MHERSHFIKFPIESIARILKWIVRTGVGGWQRPWLASTAVNRRHGHSCSRSCPINLGCRDDRVGRRRGMRGPITTLATAFTTAVTPLTITITRVPLPRRLCLTPAWVVGGASAVSLVAAGAFVTAAAPFSIAPPGCVLFRRPHEALAHAILETVGLPRHRRWASQKTASN